MKQNQLSTSRALSAAYPVGSTLEMIKKIFLISALLLLAMATANATPHIISTIAGNGTAGHTGDGSPATACELSDPYGVATDTHGNIYIADRGNNCVRKINASGIISTFAGNGTAGYSGDAGAASSAKLNQPTGVACDPSGNVYIADRVNNCIRKVNTTGVISTFAGNDTAGYSGDGHAATTAELNQPINVACDPTGNVFIVDFNNSVIRKVNLSGVISTVAGTGTPGFSGDGGPATAAKLYHSTMIACDASGNIYIDDENNDRIRKINASGIITTIAGNGTDAFSGDGGPATAAELNETWGVCADACGNVYIADEVNQRIRMINTSGIINTICGTGVRGIAGDNGPATGAQLYNPYGICIDNAGNMFIADNINERVRKIASVACAGPALPITGTTTVCEGASTTLSDATSGGSWSSSNTAVATIGSSTGTVNGITAGTTTITYMAYGSPATTTVTVNPAPSAISGSTTVALSATVMFTDTIAGGTWTSADTLVAKVCGTCGFVHGKSAGATIITYSIGSCYVTKAVTVARIAAISGSSSICTGSSTTLTDTVSGGLWVSSNPLVATIGLTTGVITGVLAGTSTISYNIGGGHVTTVVTVHTTPSAISGPSVVAIGGVITLIDAMTGGNWESTNTAAATINPATGEVSGVAAGTSTISYGVSGCFVSSPMSVVPIAPITGSTAICAGSTSALTDATTGGTWSSSDTSIATVNPASGLVYGVSGGTAIISYTVSGFSRTVTMTINDVPAVGAISGIKSVQVGSGTILTDFSSGGTTVWSSSNSSVASVDASGLVTGIANGTAIISYSVTNGCGTTVATDIVTVYSGITGNIAVCQGNSLTLTDTIPGGTWSSSNTLVATINYGSGLLTGLSAGTANITYNGGGIVIATVTVLPLPSVSGTVTNITCSGYVNGNIEMTTTGGSTSGSWLYYTYVWSNGATTNGAWALTAGTYSVIATDPNGCSGTGSFIVTEPALITSSGFVTDTLLGCKVGKIELDVTGGTGAYAYTWSDGETTPDIYGLLEGEYYVNITDENGCEASAWYYVEYCTGCHQDGLRRGPATSVAPVVHNKGIQVNAYPNPFSTKTNITFTAPANGQITVEVVNAMTGVKVGTMFNEYTNAGTSYSCVLSGDNLSAGIYLYNISSNNAIYTGRVVLAK
jgi:uncharacterized protein YjdB